MKYRSIGAVVRMMAGRRTACLAVLSAAGCGVVAAARTGHATGVPANKAAARVAAARALQKVVLPSGARPTDLARWGGFADGAPASLHLLNVHRDWRVPGDPRAVFKWIKAHPPAGSTIISTGSTGQWGRTVSWDVTFALPAVPGRVYQEGLGVEISAAKAGGSAVRADGWAIWLTPRPVWEQVPPGVRAVAVSADVIGKRTFPVTTVTAPGKVAQLVGYINSLEVTQAMAMSCPVFGPGRTLLSLRFLPGSSGAPQVRVAEDGCFGLSFTIGKRSGPALMETTDLADKLSKLGVLPVCTSQQLRGSSTLASRFPALNFRNVSQAVCSLTGVARLKLFDERGRPLPTRVRPGPNTPEITVLAPGVTATVAIDWPAPRRGCNAPRVGAVDVSLPGVYHTIPVKVGSGTRSFAPCNGKVRVEPIALSFPR